MTAPADKSPAEVSPTAASETSNAADPGPVVSPAGEPLVGVIMGSRSDWPTMRGACEVLAQFGIPFEARVVSAHRTPDWMHRYAGTAHQRGVKVIIAGAGGAAHLPGMVAASTPLPVLGVPVQSRALQGLDSLLSIVQMPAGVPVGTLAIGSAGARNAGLLAARMLAIHDASLQRRLIEFAERQTQQVMADSQL
jgi:5-(carboxyamino)imidazole ribonucleotide mutase